MMSANAKGETGLMGNSRKLVYITAAAVSVALALTACGGGGGGEESTDAEVTITIALGGSGDNWDLAPDNVIATGISEAIGAQVVHEAMPEDISASLAAGDSPDVFVVTRNQLQTYVEQGLVLDLSDYRDQLGDYVDFVGEDTVNLGQVDGQLSAITPKVNNNNDYTYWVRQDWLDNLGLEMPTDAEEFREILRAFTEDDPDGNGQNDTYGLTGRSPVNTFKPLWGAFGTPGPGTIYIDDAGEVRAGYEDEGLVDAIEYIAALEADGYIDPDSYSQETLDARDRGFQGVAGVMAMPWTAVVKEPSAGLGRAANPDAVWAQIDQLQQADGSPGMLAVGTDAARMYALPATLAGDDAKIEKIIDLINYVATPEGNEFAMWGEEGVHYEVGDDGAISPLAAREDEDNGVFFVYLVAGREESPYIEALFPDLMPYIDVAHNQPLVTDWTAYVVAPEDYSQSEAERYAEDQMAQMLSGQAPASGYADFLSTLEGQMGYSQFVDAAREQLAGVSIDS